MIISDSHKLCWSTTYFTICIYAILWPLWNQRIFTDRASHKKASMRSPPLKDLLCYALFWPVNGDGLTQFTCILCLESSLKGSSQKVNKWLSLFHTRMQHVCTHTSAYTYTQLIQTNKQTNKQMTMSVCQHNTSAYTHSSVFSRQGIKHEVHTHKPSCTTTVTHLSLCRLVAATLMLQPNLAANL